MNIEVILKWRRQQIQTKSSTRTKALMFPTIAMPSQWIGGGVVDTSCNDHAIALLVTLGNQIHDKQDAHYDQSQRSWLRWIKMLVHVMLSSWTAQNLWPKFQEEMVEGQLIGCARSIWRSTQTMPMAGNTELGERKEWPNLGTPLGEKPSSDVYRLALTHRRRKRRIELGSIWGLPRHLYRPFYVTSPYIVTFF